jgi:small-conductance mechanosensitive channel
MRCAQNRAFRVFGVVVAWFWLALGVALAEETAEVPSLDEMRERLAELDTALERDLDMAALARVRESALLIQTQAESIAADLEPQLGSLDARLAELGSAPEDPAGESDEVRATRSGLSSRRNEVDAKIRQARLLSVEASQVADRIAAIRQAKFHAELYQRAAPPYSNVFWSGLAASRQRDLQRWDILELEGRGALTAVTAPDARGRFFALAGLALLVLVGGRWVGEWFIRRQTTLSIPGSHLRRSALAFGIVLMFTTSAWVCARLIFEGLDWSGALSERLHDLALRIVGLVTFCALVASLGRALLSSNGSSWRLPPLSDEVAEAMRFVPALLALTIFAVTLLEYGSDAIRGSLALSVAIGTLSALLLTGVLVFALWRVGRARRRAQRARGDREARREFGLNISVTLGWCAAAIIIIALLAGYTALALFVSKQVVWSVVVLAGLYLLMHLSNDLITTGLHSRGRTGIALSGYFGIEPRRLDQAAVLLSAIVRVALVLVALTALVESDGLGPGDLFAQLTASASGIAIGELTLSPGVLLRALLVFLLASFLFKLLQNWFGSRYLPTTRLEPGMQSSLTSLVGYAGVIAAVAMALATVGVGVERITWIVSALSVGIGFGLQAIVQNFISGLILLIEQPVKIGDWVIVGDAEGDVRRINVRTTEIRTGDRATVLVPNSELITKVVRNRTNPCTEGLVKLMLPMPLSADAQAVRTLILDVFTAHPEVLDTPAPAVFLDDVGAGRLLFNASGFVRSPRMAYGVRSEIMFELLQRLQDANMPMYEPTLLAGGPAVR